jgi:mandelate racemase
MQLARGDGDRVGVLRLTVRDVTARGVVVPLGRAVATRVGSFAEWPLLLVELRTEEGVTGRGYLAPYLPRSLRYLAPVVRDLGERLAGGPVAPAQNGDAARRSLTLLGNAGMAAMAIAGVDMACWDALAKAAGLPLAVLLGGTVGPVRAYNSNGLGLAPPDRLADEALALLGEGGFHGLKVRVGRERLQDDVAAVRNVRRAVGDDVLLMLDFNQGLTLGEALRRCRALDAEDVTWIEEPIAYDDLAGNARLARETATPIQLGENFYGPRAMQDALAAQACDLVMPDLMRIGGVTGWLRAAAIASAWGMDKWSHHDPEISSHHKRVTPTPHRIEWQDWAHPVLAQPFPVKDGFVHPPDVPGNGLEWDEEAVRRYAVDC